MEYIGFLMMVIGAAGMDGNNMLMSGIIALAGLAIIRITAHKEKSFTQQPTKANVRS